MCENPAVKKKKCRKPSRYVSTFRLSRQLGIKPTIETVKKLKMAQQEMARNKYSDP